MNGPLADPISITILVLVLLFAIVQGLLIFGLCKRIRPILILWLVIESLTTLILVGGLIAAAFLIEMIHGILISVRLLNFKDDGS